MSFSNTLPIFTLRIQQPYKEFLVRSSVEYQPFYFTVAFSIKTVSTLFGYPVIFSIFSISQLLAKLFGQAKKIQKMGY